MPAENHSSVIYFAFNDNDCPRTELLTRGAQHNTEHLPVLVFVQPLDFDGDLQRQFSSSVDSAARMRSACQGTAFYEDDLALNYPLAKDS